MAICLSYEVNKEVYWLHYEIMNEVLFRWHKLYIVIYEIFPM